MKDALLIVLLLVIIAINIYELYRPSRRFCRRLQSTETYESCDKFCQPLTTDSTLGDLIQSKLSRPLLDSNGFVVTQSQSSPPLSITAYMGTKCRYPSITMIGRIECDIVCTNPAVLDVFNEMLSFAFAEPVTSITARNVTCSLEFFFQLASIAEIMNDRLSDIFVMDIKLNHTIRTTWRVEPDEKEMNFSGVVTQGLSTFYTHSVLNPPPSCTFELATMKAQPSIDVIDVFDLINSKIPHTVPVPAMNRLSVYKMNLVEDDKKKILFELIRKITSVFAPQSLTRGTLADARWMSTVSGLKRLTELSIPGAHDALTYEWAKPMDLKNQVIANWAQTQEFSVYELLSAGTRYFDVRIAWVNGQWVGQHNDYPNENVTYHSVLKQLRMFLTENPSEIVLWKLKLYTPENDVLKQLHQQYLTSMVLPISYIEQPLSAIWQTGQNVLLITDDDQVAPYQESKKITNVDDAITVLTPLYSQVDPKSISSKKLLVLQWIAVYNESNKDNNSLYSVRSIAAELNDSAVLSDQLPRPPANRVQNVVLIDFADATANRVIYRRNL